MNQARVRPEQVNDRRDDDQRVDAVEHATVTGDDAPGVFDAGRALQQRLDEITELADSASEQPERQRVSQR